MQSISEGGCLLETAALGGVRGGAVSIPQQVEVHLSNAKGQRAYPTRCVCAPPPLLHICPRSLLLLEDALRTVLNVGLHHSCRLHRGGCNPILFGGAAAQPVRRKRALLCALTRSPRHSSPFSAECHPLFSPHLFTPCSVRLVGGAHTQTQTHTHASGIVASHCSPTDRAPVQAGATPRRFVFIIIFQFLNAFAGGIYRMHASPVTCPSMFTSETASDLPESTLPSHRQSHLPSAHTRSDSTDCH